MEPAESGLSCMRLTNAAEGARKAAAVYALRSLPSRVFSPAPSSLNMTMGIPSRSTTVTDVLYPMVRHCAIAALAMACASASEMFFCVMTLCAPAGDEMTAATERVARVLSSGDISNLPVLQSPGHLYEHRTAANCTVCQPRNPALTADRPF